MQYREIASCGSVSKILVVSIKFLLPEGFFQFAGFSRFLQTNEASFLKSAL